MTNLATIGEFLGRRVRLASLSSLHDFKVDGEASSSLFLVHFGAQPPTSVDLVRVLSTLIRASPVGVAISGAGSSHAFDILLRSLQQTATVGHVMTKRCPQEKIEDVVGDFLTATWPAEECFDRWTSYTIVAVELASDDEDALRSAVMQRRGPGAPAPLR